MNVVLAVLVVGLASLAFRLVPLLTGRQVPATVARGAGWAGLSVIAGITVRSTLLIEDPGVPFASVAALLAVLVGLALAFRGRSVLVAVAAGGASYAVLAAALAAVG